MGASLGSVRVQLEGLSLEKLLSRAASNGVFLREVVKTDLRSLSATVRADELPRLQALADQAGWRLTQLHESSLRRGQRLAARRGMLAAGLIVFLALTWAATQVVWFVNIQGAGPYAGEVRTVLEEAQARPGRWKTQLPLEALRLTLERRLTGVSWVDVRVSGVTLVVECVQAEIGQPKTYGGAPGNIVAARDGVVTALNITAGTAKVKVGDAVRTGQVLVVGQERTADEGTKPIAAQGQVFARVWYEASAALPMTEWVGTPTGNTEEQSALVTPWLTWPQQVSPGYEQMDREDHTQVVGGIFVPIALVTTHFTEVELFPQTRDEATVKAEAYRAAERLALEKVPFGVQIVDKWVDYSMMEDNNLRAQVILEAIEDIASDTNSSG